MTMSLESAALAMREAMRETVRKYSLWYLIQGALMVLGGILALVYPDCVVSRPGSFSWLDIDCQWCCSGYQYLAWRVRQS
jgi:hypothetical protein